MKWTKLVLFLLLTAIVMFEASSATARDLFIVDPAVEDYQTLVSSINSGTNVAILDSSPNGMRQINRIISRYPGARVLHIISHGGPGFIRVGESVLSLKTLHRHEPFLREIGRRLSAKGEIVLYGCRVAGGEAGRGFIRRLTRLTGATVVASTDDTGNPAAGGDWVLETHGRNAAAAYFDHVRLKGFRGLLPASIQSNIIVAPGVPKVLTSDMFLATAGPHYLMQTPSQGAAKLNGNTLGYLGAVTNAQIAAGQVTYTHGGSQWDDAFYFSDGGQLSQFSAYPSTAPTAPTLNPSTVDSGEAGATVGTLSSSDAESWIGDSVSYSITSDPDDMFTIDGSTLKLQGGKAADYGTKQSHQVTVRATDTSGLYNESIKTVTVNQSTITANLSATVQGNESGPVSIQYTVTLTATNNTGSAVIFDTSFTGGTAATGSDFTDESGAATISVADGSTTGTLNVPVTDDSLLEATETAELTISNPSDGSVSIGAATATANITDDDASAYNVSIAATDSSATEGSDNGELTITLKDSGGTPYNAPMDIEVTFTVGGTATEETDYASIGATATISSGSSTAVITVDTSGDTGTTFEGDETVLVTLQSTDIGVSVGTPDNATVTIADDDASAYNVSILATDASATEGSDNGAFTITLKDGGGTPGNAPQDIEVTFTVGGTATEGTDYANIGTTATISSGSSTAVVTIDTSGDTGTTFEGDETVLVTLQSTDIGVSIGTPDNATVTIADDDASAYNVSIAATDASATEGSDNGAFTITLKDGGGTPVNAPQDIEVTFTVGGTATEGTDYANIGTTATISSGSSTAVITIDTSGDTATSFEGNETVLVTLQSTDIGVTVDTPDNATVTITDDDSATAALSVTTVGVEDSTTPTDIVYTVTLSKTNNTGSAITFDFNTADNTATAGSDYTAVSGGTISVTDGSATGTLSVTVLDDLLLEGTETVDATISNPSNGSVTISTATATANLTDDEAVTANLSATVQGNETGPVSIQYTVTLTDTNNTGSAITFTFNTADNTATAGSDYTAISGGSISVANGATTGTITVTVLDDGLLEATETVDGTISNSSHPGVTIGTATATGDILDDETATAALSVTINGDETGPVNIQYTITLSETNNTGSAITFDFNTSDNTATGGNDYTAVSGGSISVVDGATTGTTTVTVIDDSDLEITETVDGTISNSSNASVTIATATATANILDDDTATAALSVTTQGNESTPVNIQYTVTLTATNGTGSPITFDFNTAAAGSDYTAVSGGSISVADGATTGTITVTVLDDALLEATETVDATISNSSNPNVTIGSATATANILDDESATATLSATVQGNETGPVSIEYTVTLSKTNNTGSAITFTFNTADNTAEAGNDYTAVSGGSISVADGATTGTITLSVLDDSLLEATETVNGIISNSSNPSVTIATAMATGDILDDETATAALSATTDGVEDPTTPTDIVYTVTLSTTNNTGSAITFVFNTADNTATAGGDYTAVSGGSISVADGAATGTISVTVLDDLLLEGTETVDATISNSSHPGVTIGTATATANITDDEAVTANLSATVQGNETGPVSIQYTVTLSDTNNTGSAVTFTFNTADNTATAGSDYTAESGGSISVADGAATGTITVTVLDDSLLEATETVDGTISNSSHPGVTIGTATATGDILDDETATAALSVTINGDETGPVNIHYMVALSKINNTGSPITFTFNTADNTASGGSDYTAVSGGTISVADGAATETTTVTVIDDSDLEITETVDGTISNSSNASVTIATATATANILDDDTATANLSATVQGNETGPVSIQYTVTLTATNGTGNAITFTFNTADDTATVGNDYTAVSGGSISVADGATTGTITVSVLDDSLLEATETVGGTISNSSNPNVTIGTATATANILDDDTATTVLSVTVQGDETGTVAVQYTATLSKANNTGSAITFTFNTADNTATAGSDYTAVSGGSISVADGATTGTITVSVLDDSLLEATKTVDGIISNSSNPSVTIGTATATADILDDETATAALSVTTQGSETGPVNIVYTVTMSKTNNTGSAITFVFNTADNTATAGSDYFPLVGAGISVADGATTGTVSVTVVDDSLMEGTETVDGTISNASHTAVTIVTATATGQILDDESATANLSATVQGDEDGPVSIEYTVTLSGTNNTGSAVTFTFDTADNTAIAGSDYTAVSGGSISVADGATTGTTTVTVLNDSLLEATETVDGTISNASHPGVNIGTATATGDILDDDTATADLSATAQGNETGSVSIEYTVTLDLTNNTGSAITFTFDTADNTAVAGSDYTAVSGGSISVADGATTGTLTVTVLDDGDLEITETVDATISNPSHAGVSPGTGTATGDILDDESATVSIVATDTAASEDPADNGQFTITLSQANNTGGSLTVNYGVSGTAANGTDYVTLTGTADIADSSDTVTVDVDMTGMNDSLFEGDETVALTLTGTGHSSVAAAGSPDDTASVTIADDEAADHNVTVEATDAEAIEELDNGAFTVTLKNSAGTPTAAPQDIEVTFTTGGTATEGTDYATVGTAVTIASGTSTGTVTVDTSIDTVVVIEGDETVELTLTDVDNGLVLGAITEAAVTIIEDIWPPVIETVEAFDDDSDGDPGYGYLDRVVFTFDEDLEAGQEDLSDWILYDADGTTNLLAGLDDSAVTISGNTVTITLADNTGTGGDPFYLYESDGDGEAIQDLYTNEAETVGNNTAPAAAAGGDIETLPRLVRLNASGSSDPDGNALSYSWTQDDGPINLGISGAAFEEIAFAGRAKGTYNFTLTATDPFGAENEDTVLVTILNSKPAAKPGRNRAVDKDDDDDLDVVLEGSASRDPNSYTGYNDIVDYQWRWTSGPQEVTLTQDGSVQPLRVRPQTAEVVTRAGFDTSDLGPGAYTFTLTVTDADGLTGEASVEITVNDPGGNGTPVADAGIGLQQKLGSRILLDGHESKDPDGDPLTYRWEQVSGPPVKILRSTKVKAMVRPKEPGTYVFRLIVNDGQADSAPATVTVEMTDPGKPLPVAEIMVEGTPRETWQFAVGEEVTLDGTVLGMDEGDVNPAWSQVRGTTLTMDDPAVWDLLLSPVEEGVYVFRLDVTADGASGRGKEITVTVLGDSVPPVADAGVDQLEIMTGDLVTLDATASYDDDPGDILDYTWTQLLGPPMQLSDPYTAQPTFTPGDTGACLFQLIVFDGDYESAPDLVYVVVHSEDEHVPTAQVVDDTINDATVGKMVIMNGTPSVDHDSQDTLVYQWVQIGGPMVVLDDPYSSVPSFTPSLAGVHLFTLYVDDSRDRSVGQTVTINVGPAGAVVPGNTETGPGGTSCFIATAAYETPFADDVVVLRRFRDRWLLPTATGRELVKLYYRCSPPLAETVSGNENMKRFTRTLLAPAVRLLDVMLLAKK